MTLKILIPANIRKKNYFNHSIPVQNSLIFHKLAIIGSTQAILGKGVHARKANAINYIVSA